MLCAVAALAVLVRAFNEITSVTARRQLRWIAWGTALGVIRAAAEQGKNVTVLADETRPFLQGARLTAWELTRDRIATTVITDNMAGWMMQRGEVDLVVVGADRIAANGDVANKIGTYAVAVLAHEHGLPFYVAAPASTIDLGTPDGSHIPIEERNAREVTHVGSTRVAAEAAWKSGASTPNPASCRKRASPQGETATPHGPAPAAIVVILASDAVSTTGDAAAPTGPAAAR